MRRNNTQNNTKIHKIEKNIKNKKANIKRIIEKHKISN
jgi:hypothetical protein